MASRTSQRATRSVNLGKMALPPVLSKQDVARMSKPHLQPAPWLKALLARIAERLKGAPKA
jgi:hypothetical protein